jgi:predicted helicase
VAGTLEATESLGQLLDKLYFSATDSRDQGDKVERMMVEFFRTCTLYRQRFEDVWLWMEWPNRPDAHRDNGIDLVARERESGDLVAIQCKFFDPARNLYEHDIDSFLPESGKQATDFMIPCAERRTEGGEESGSEHR